MLEYSPNEHTFEKLAQGVSAIPVHCKLLSDQLTPVSAYQRLAAKSEHAFLLESVVGGEKIARYSFLGADPLEVVESKGRCTEIRPGDHDGDATVLEDADPLAELERVLKRYKVTHQSGLPRFLGGAVGFAGYDLARHYENLPDSPPDDRQLPDLLFGIYDRMVIFDHVRKLIIVVAHAHINDSVTPKEAYRRACERIEETVTQLRSEVSDPLRPMITTRGDASNYDSTISSKAFESAVDRCKSYIRAGDIFQVVISQRLTAKTVAKPFDVYRALRAINPSPFMFYVQSPSVTLVGASPEILCRIDGDTVSTRPLAGTKPRGRTEAEDLGLERELLADPKERAEHVMLVDLGRNDLARVCVPGSVQVDDLMSIERYSHVMHICSSVSGQLAKNRTAFDAIRSVLPVGTVSGAPKIRAMEIIDELEPVKRGPYAGAVGYIDFSGNMDTCIALRTLVITPDADGSYRVDAQSGAGIVADSEPASEYQEALNKARSMLAAIQLADAWATGTKPTSVEHTQ